MRKFVIKAGRLNAASTLHARRRRANDNVVDVPMAAGAEACGAFTPVIFDGVGAPHASVVQSSRNPDTPTIVRAQCTMPDGGPLVSNANHPGAFDGPRTARTFGWIARLWRALWREWT